MPAPIPVIVNATAGKGHRSAEVAALEQLFLDAGSQARIMPARSGAEIRELALRTAKENPAVIVAGGGDGTTNCIASVLVGTDISLGILPLGTLNHFARDLGIPLELKAAAGVIAAGRQQRVDVGDVNGKIFLNNSSLGLYPHIVRNRELLRQRTGAGRWPALLWATWTVMRRSPFLNVRVRFEDGERAYRAPAVFIGNNVYVAEGFSIGRRERLDRGVLSLYITTLRGRRALLGLALRALFGLLQQARDFEARTAQTIDVETRRPHVQVAADGEVLVLQSPLHFRIRAGALRVIVPESKEP
jgi:diacylglycerol kinase family enzyme